MAKQGASLAQAKQGNKNEKKTNFISRTSVHKFRCWTSWNSMLVDACCTIKTSRKSGRVAECTWLEIRRTERYRGFESHLFLQVLLKNARNSGHFFVSCYQQLIFNRARPSKSRPRWWCLLEAPTLWPTGWPKRVGLLHLAFVASQWFDRPL